jgi:hypothetical protein
MDEFLKELEQAGDLSGNLTFLDVTFVLVLSFTLALGIAFIYRFTHRGVSYSQGYAHTLVIMTTVVAMIMLIIGSNIARAFALVGALSVIRFRNAMKETRDVGFIFLGMAVGMAVGTRFYLLALFSTTLLSAFIVALYKFNMFAKEIRERILRVQIPADQDHEAVLEEPFLKFLDEQRIISIETVRAGALNEVVYSVVMKRNASPQSLLEAIRARNGNQKATLILGQQEIDI